MYSSSPYAYRWCSYEKMASDDVKRDRILTATIISRGLLAINHGIVGSHPI
jgi:hypothetical protein